MSTATDLAELKVIQEINDSFADVIAQEKAKAEITAKRAHHKPLRKARRLQRRADAKRLGHKLGHNSRRCKRCKHPWAAIEGKQCEKPVQKQHGWRAR